MYHIYYTNSMQKNAEEQGHDNENGFLRMDCLCKHYDDSFQPQEEVDHLMRQLTKSDFTEVFYECFADKDMEISIELMPVEIMFYDYSATSDG